MQALSCSYGEGPLIPFVFLFQLDYFVGESMSPSIIPGAVVCYSPRERYYIGDVIVFSYDPVGYFFAGHTGQTPHYLVHRVVATGYRLAYPKGDNNAFEDSPVSWNDIAGAVVPCGVAP